MLECGKSVRIGGGRCGIVCCGVEKMRREVWGKAGGGEEWIEV